MSSQDEFQMAMHSPPKTAFCDGIEKEDHQMSEELIIWDSAMASKICHWQSFFEHVSAKFKTRKRGSILSYIEIQDSCDPGSRDGNKDRTISPKEQFSDIFILISEAISADDFVCWHEGRFLVLLNGSSAAAGYKTLRRIARRIAAVPTAALGSEVHRTPAVGYVELNSAGSVHDVWDMAEAALEYAKSSLEIEPFRYNPKSRAFQKTNPVARLLGLWTKAPPPLALLVQAVLSLVVGLGAPFLLYAMFDAWGVDISGSVYIGVVVVLVITATMIWLEGFLALKPTAPPKNFGAPAPLATVIIPAYLPNEADTIVETLRAFLRLDYPNIIQIIIGYNSPGARMPVEDELDAIAASEALKGRFVIEPVRVWGSTSKAQNVNAVIGRVRGQFVGIFDADHHPLPDSVSRAWRWLSNGWDIVQGRCSIRNGSESWVARMVAIEFEQIYAVSHPGRARFHGFGIFGGSNGFWRTAVLHETRMRHSMLTEDIDSSIRAVEGGYRIAGDRDLISEELAPTSVAQLLNQRLRWAQGWFQVSLQRILPALASPRVSLRQKLGLFHLLIWREFFPWYSIQVVPIMAYWVWVYGWHYIHWAVPIFVCTTIFTFSAGPGQLVFAYLLARKSMREKKMWFIQYLFISTFLYSPFKDAISRIAHLKEAMRERAWRVTPRAVPSKATGQMARGTLGALALILAVILLLASNVGRGWAATSDRTNKPELQISSLIGGEVKTINAARLAAESGRNAEAADLFERAIQMVPRRRPELLREYADALSYSGRSAQAAPLYRELLSSPNVRASDRTQIMTRLAAALVWSEQYQPALAVYDQLLAAAPKDADLALHRAQVLAALGRQNEAVAALDRTPRDQWATGPLGAMGDDILIDAARTAAKTDRHDESAQLFDRAIAHNPSLRPRLLQEYADQLTFSSHPKDAVPLYKEVLERSPPASKTYQDAQRGLALALTWADASNEALAVWTAHLKIAPQDVDAILHKAQILSTLHHNGEALQTYRTAYEIDRQNKTAKRGIVDETVNLARAAARNDRNVESAALFNTAIGLDGRKRRELLCEYADQLTFSGRATDAIPLYRELLDRDPLSAADRKRATRGLANAYVSAGRSQDAVDAYKALADASPDDMGVKWTSLVVAARNAAWTDHNKESADLFAQAMALDSARSADIAREYADQLAFTDRAIDAIPIYRQVLGGATLSAVDRKRATMGLADAYASAGQIEQAEAAYMALGEAFPDDKDVHWSRLVFQARQDARADKNRESAALFDQAIKLDPHRGAAILREYADQLTFSGQAAQAIPLYRDVLASSTLSVLDRKRASTALADAYALAGRPDEGSATYAALVLAFPGDLDVQWNRLVFAARQAAQSDRNKESAQLFAQAIKIDATRRDGILREYADQLTYMGRAGDGIPLYREVLKQPALTDANRWAAKKNLALAYEWSGRLEAAQSAFGELIEKYPNDKALKWEKIVVSARQAARSDRNKDAADLFAQAIVLMPDRRLSILKEYADKLAFSNNAKAAIPLYRELLAKSAKAADTKTYELDLAQALAWDSQFKLALAEYERVLAVYPRDVNARDGLAQVLSWSGRQDAAKAAYQQVLAADPNNPEAQRGLAQVEDWQGHHRVAQALLSQRLNADPSDLEARRLLVQSEIWMGRPDKAMSEVDTALTLQKAHGPAARQQADIDHAPPSSQPVKTSRSEEAQMAKASVGAAPSLRSANLPALVHADFQQ